MSGRARRISVCDLLICVSEHQGSCEHVNSKSN